MNGIITVGCGAIIDDHFLWQIGVCTDVLMKIDWKTGVVVDTYQIPGAEIKEYSHTVIRRIKNCIYIFPLYGDGFYSFNIESKTFEKLDMYCDGQLLNCMVRMAEVSTHGNLVFVDYRNNHVYEYDPDERIVLRRDAELLRSLENRRLDISKPVFYWQNFKRGEEWFIPIYNTNLFISLDLQTFRHSIYDLGSNQKIQFIGGDDKRLVFTTSGRESLNWSGGGVEANDISEIIQDDGRDLYPFCIGGKTLYIPFCQRKAYIDGGKGIKKLIIPYVVGKEDLFPADSTYSQYESFFEMNDKLFFESRATGDLFCIDLAEERVSVTSLAFGDMVLQKMMNQLIRDRGDKLLFEGQGMDLGKFLKCI